MKTQAKKLLCMTMSFGLIAGNTLTSFAGTWRQGAGTNQNKWWYDFDNGTYAASGWQWIDGNNDGIAERYYFDNAGWMLADTTTPDGYIVNASGAWTENGAVKTQKVQGEQSQNVQNENTQNQAAQGTYFAGNYDGSGNWVTNSEMIDSVYWGDYMMFRINYFENIENLSLAQTVDEWAQSSERGAHWKSAFDTYGISCDELSNKISYFNGAGGTVIYTTSASIPASSLHDVEAVTGMIINMITDGMAQYTISAVQESSGGPATVTINYKMGG